MGSVTARVHRYDRPNGVALKGPLTTPIIALSINVHLRRHFDLYANVRPAISFPGTRSRFEGIDIITVLKIPKGRTCQKGEYFRKTAKSLWQAFA